MLKRKPVEVAPLPSKEDPIVAADEESPRRMMRLSDSSPRPLFSPAVLARGFESLKKGATLLKWSKKRQAPVAHRFRLHVPSVPLDEDTGELPGPRLRGAGGLVEPAAEEPSTLSWDKEPAGGWFSFGASSKRVKLLNLRDVFKVDVWETPSANLIPGACCTLVALLPSSFAPTSQQQHKFVLRNHCRAKLFSLLSCCGSSPLHHLSHTRRSRPAALHAFV